MTSLITSHSSQDIKAKIWKTGNCRDNWNAEHECSLITNVIKVFHVHAICALIDVINLVQSPPNFTLSCESLVRCFSVSEFPLRGEFSQHVSIATIQTVFICRAFKLKYLLKCCWLTRRISFSASSFQSDSRILLHIQSINIRTLTADVIILFELFKVSRAFDLLASSLALIWFSNDWKLEYEMLSIFAFW